MPAPHQKPGATGRLLSELPLELTDLGVRLRQADFARLIGTSRAHVSGLVARQVIPTKPGGTIDPSEAFAALLRRDANAHRLKVLVDIRRQLDDAEARATDALARATRAEARLAELEPAVDSLIDQAVGIERAFWRLIDATGDFLGDDDALQLAHDQAIDLALAASGDQRITVSDALTALVAQLRPELVPAMESAGGEEGAPSLAHAARGRGGMDPPEPLTLVGEDTPTGGDVPRATLQHVADAALAEEGGESAELPDETIACHTGQDDL